MTAPEKFLKPYNPQKTESSIYKKWEESGYFNPDNLPGERTRAFTIIMPPPNVTGILHMGHALMLTLQDILIRYKRMQGFKTLWLPGTDHAAIATQSKVEKDLAKEKLHRRKLGREEFLRRVETFARESREAIVNQIKVMGASCDWSREAYTLDEKRSRAVAAMFTMMYDDGLIYRGHRIVNWDPKGQTTISDDEVVHVEEKTTFYYLQYGPFVIGTARPETKFGDKYVVMHPDDTRYAAYYDGQKLELEWINGPITATVVKDSAIDTNFGTGVMTITPWHSAVDFDIASRHELDREQIIDEHGRLLPIAGEFTGLKINEARPKIVEKLRTKGLLVKEEDYTHHIATAERTGGIVEPQIKLQWFVDVNRPVAKRGNKTLKELMREPLESGRITILPEHFLKTYFHWVDNLRDWCISRQIWYGHRIPVWYRSEEIFCGTTPPEGGGWVQDEDTLDTWFSSGLWTFSTLGWPEKTKDLMVYHPTDLLETGYEILFFWVARMILMSEYALGDIPFRTVYLHGTVRDQQGRKMSKSLGNGIDPMDVAKEFGTDAGRMALIMGNTPGTDTKIWNEKIRAYKLFANKLWNIARFVLEQWNEKTALAPEDFSAGDRDLLAEFNALATDVTSELEEYRLYLAAEKIYHFAWHRFADEILEESKIILTGTDEVLKRSRQNLLMHLLAHLLKLLHPFMPFITEEIWAHTPQAGQIPLLMVAEWPVAEK